MKNCNTCGTLIPNRARKCRSCGAKITSEIEDQYSQKYYDKYIASQDEPSPKYKKMESSSFNKDNKQKSVFVLILLLLFPGTGHLYIGNKRRGIIFVTVFFVIVAAYTTASVLQMLELILITATFYLGAIVWAVIDTIEEIKILRANKKNYKQKLFSMKGRDYPVFK